MATPVINTLRPPPAGKSTHRVYSGKFMPACGRQAAEEGLEAGDRH